MFGQTKKYLENAIKQLDSIESKIDMDLIKENQELKEKLQGLINTIKDRYIEEMGSLSFCKEIPKNFPLGMVEAEARSGVLRLLVDEYNAYYDENIVLEEENDNATNK